jgi:hypothetical protein
MRWQLQRARAVSAHSTIKLFNFGFTPLLLPPHLKGVEGHATAPSRLQPSSSAALLLLLQRVLTECVWGEVSLQWQLQRALAVAAASFLNFVDS